MKLFDFVYLKEFHGLNYYNPIRDQEDLYRFVEEKKRLTDL